MGRAGLTWQLQLKRALFPQTLGRSHLGIQNNLPIPGAGVREDHKRCCWLLLLHVMVLGSSAIPFASAFPQNCNPEALRR